MKVRKLHPHRLKKEFERLGFSQSRIAYQLGFSRDHINRVLLGYIQPSEELDIHLHLLAQSLTEKGLDDE